MRFPTQHQLRAFLLKNKKAQFTKYEGGTCPLGRLIGRHVGRFDVYLNSVDSHSMCRVPPWARRFMDALPGPAVTGAEALTALVMVQRKVK